MSLCWINIHSFIFNSALSFIRAIACYMGCRFCLFKVLHQHNCANSSQPESAAKSPESRPGCGHRVLWAAALFFLSGAAPGSVAHWHHRLKSWLCSHVAFRKTFSYWNYTEIILELTLKRSEGWNLLYCSSFCFFLFFLTFNFHLEKINWKKNKQYKQVQTWHFMKIQILRWERKKQDKIGLNLV